MLEDKKLKELLREYAMEETSADFTNIVMSRLQCADLWQKTVPLFKLRLPQMLAALFAAICGALLLLSFFIQSTQLPVHFSVKLPENYFSQIISFLIVFWIVMLVNQLLQRKKLSYFL
ncbi:hypothetical protein [Segetibacter koreensis]|uniref:hypothetical protein n=1 Tax=Segetibacter koreensis TaxID=398037 RepID=UPI00037601A1|nr:hypothetical protein [Segetibacter koreensis]